jgi:hypothetical protein
MALMPEPAGISVVPALFTYRFKVIWLVRTIMVGIDLLDNPPLAGTYTVSST